MILLAMVVVTLAITGAILATGYALSALRPGDDFADEAPTIPRPHKLRGTWRGV